VNAVLSSVFVSARQAAIGPLKKPQEWWLCIFHLDLPFFISRQPMLSVVTGKLVRLRPEKNAADMGLRISKAAPEYHRLPKWTPSRY
jgi:hypothetical protein